MAWSNTASGSRIPAKSKRVVRLRQDNQCVCIDHEICLGVIQEYDHVTNVASIKVERSHANDPALLQGVCKPCHKKKTQAEAQQARHDRKYRKPQEHPGLRVDPNPGHSIDTPNVMKGEQT